MYKVLFILIGFLLSIVGLSYIIIYLNLFTMGYSLGEYLIYIFTRYECIFFFVGYLILILAITKKKEKKHGIYL